MIKSMTGFGQARGGRPPFNWSIEIRSWNHRFFECSTRLPSLLNGLEEKVRDVVHRRIKRGKISVSVSLRNGSDSGPLVLDEKKIDFYLRAIRNIQRKYHLKDSINMNTLLSIPGLFTTNPREELTDAHWRELSLLLDQAAGRLVQTEIKEGAALARDLKKRISFIEKSLAHVEAVRKRMLKERLERLQARVAELVEANAVNPKRLEEEIILFIERSDITEELVRAQHHLSAFGKALEETSEVGKKLDFIAQEILREVNTIVSKSQDAVIADHVVGIKSELEKIREQIQNVE